MASALCPLGASCALLMPNASYNRLGMNSNVPLRLGNTMFGSNVALRNAIGGNVRRIARNLSASAKVGIVCAAVEVRLCRNSVVSTQLSLSSQKSVQLTKQLFFFSPIPSLIAESLQISSANDWSSRPPLQPPHSRHLHPGSCSHRHSRRRRLHCWICSARISQNNQQICWCCCRCCHRSLCHLQTQGNPSERRHH